MTLRASSAGELAPPKVWSTAEVCDHLSISREALRKLRKPARSRVNFPTPTQLAIGPVWDTEQVRAWHLDRKDGHALDLLALHRAGVDRKDAAASTGVPVRQAGRWLKSILAD